jgi:hypothetical protein
VPAPDEEQKPPSHDDFRDDEPLNGDSRLDSFFADEPPAPSPVEPDPSNDLNGGARLDDYLPMDEPPSGLESESFSEDDSSRLDDYAAPSEPPQEVRLSTEHLYKEEEDDTSRLNDYLTPETAPEGNDVDASSRLDDVFADDPFKSPDPAPETSSSEEVIRESYSVDQDPFGEPPEPVSTPAPADPAPDSGSLLSRDDLWSESTPQEPADEHDFLDIFSDDDQKETSKEAEPIDASDLDFLKSVTATEQLGDELTPESDPLEEWDYLDPATSQTQENEAKPEESIDAGEWDYLDTSPPPGQPEEEIPADSIDPGEWEPLEPAPASEQPEGERTPEPDAGGEWDFLDPGPSTEELDGGDSETKEPGPSEDWSFLDPGPTADLLADDSEQAPAVETDGEDAGWLDMLQDPASRQDPLPEAGSSAESQQPQTDWLDKIRRLNQSSDLVDEDSSFPDWLAATGKTAEFGEEDPESSDDVPDWLRLDDDDSLNEFLRKKDLTNEEYKPKVTTDSLDDPEVPDEPEALDPDLSDSQQIKFPSWAEEEKKKKEQQRLKAKSGADTDGGAEGPVEPLQVEDEFFDDLFDEELPGWLTADASEDVRQNIGFDLAEAELPGWVEAMRPVVESTDASGLDEDEEYIENYGPLAGIPSVLPAEAEIGIDFDKAVQKPLDLLATKKHKEYVDQLKQLIGDESKSKTTQLPSPPKTQRVLRWLIAALMLVTIAGTLIFTTSIDAAPLTDSQIYGTGFNALYEEIDILYDGQPVLIAFDYQPAAAGEMHTAAASVVDHLMEQGTFLTFISTQPTGPALAEQFLDSTQSHHNYLHTQKYINLGYIPGEAAGLLSFMIAPEKIIPLAYDGSNAWESPPLISIDRIGDFQMILVITDDPNTAKIWIEQVGTRLNKTPLTMVVSAQVEPLIQPYFRTAPRQISGYVAGIIDSMNYEVLTERPFLAHKNWLPFNLGIMISVGIIFIGGLTNGVLSLLSRRRNQAEGESK